MSIEQALAVHAYLANVPEQDRSKDERQAWQDAWVTIIAHAKQAMHGSR